MLQNLKKRDKGFTIIEVLIVLAIAGLILLIVFLAVPALQRNAHNTSRKNDVANLLGAMNEYVNNNDGTLPADQSSLGSGTTATVGTGSTNTANAKLGLYDAADASIVSSVPGTFPDVNHVVIIKGAVCSGTSATTTGASNRNYSAEYTLEGGAKQCQQGS